MDHADSDRPARRWSRPDSSCMGSPSVCLPGPSIRRPVRLRSSDPRWVRHYHCRARASAGRAGAGSTGIGGYRLLGHWVILLISSVSSSERRRSAIEMAVARSRMTLLILIRQRRSSSSTGSC